MLITYKCMYVNNTLTEVVRYLRIKKQKQCLNKGVDDRSGGFRAEEKAREGFGSFIPLLPSEVFCELLIYECLKTRR